MHVPLYLHPITCEDEMYAVNQKLFKSLADKWYISLIIYLKIQFKPNIALELQIEAKP